MILPLHRPQGREPKGAKRVGAVGNLPAKLGVTIPISQPVDPSTAAILAPKGRVISSNDLRGLPHLLDDLRRISPFQLQRTFDRW